ncbi:MAG: hypothetical protein IKC87_07405 [Clostridia bacterium]|nr:hypothetical protein [Clostridia bacterium]
MNTKGLIGTSLSKNMIMSLVSRIVTLITGLIIQREILLAYGSVLNGLTSSISQVMSYLILLEAGLGTASIQALYAPLADEDWDKVSGILSATKSQYKKIAGIFILLLLVVSAVLPFAVIDEVEYGVAALLTLVTGGSYVLSYIVGGKYKAILNSDRKVYVLYTLEVISVVLSCILRVIALHLGFDIVTVQIINLATILIKNVGYVIYVKHRYKNVDHNAAPDMPSISKRKNVIVHSIAGVVVNHTDIMILTLFASMSVVSVYSIYNLVFAQFSILFQTTLGSALQGNLGRLYNKDKEQFKQHFSLYETIFTVLLFIISSISIIMILPFVKLYTSGVNDADYIDFWLPLLFTLIFLMNTIRVPTITAINVAGAFEETQRDALIEAIINLVVSITLFAIGLGIYGLLIGTVVSFLYRTTTSIVYAYKNIIERSAKNLIRTIIVNSSVFIALYVVLAIIAPVNVTSWFGWILGAVIVSVICIASFGISNLIFNYKTVKNTFSDVKALFTR